jgi:hypothetical protein
MEWSDMFCIEEAAAEGFLDAIAADLPVTDFASVNWIEQIDEVWPLGPLGRSGACKKFLDQNAFTRPKPSKLLSKPD